MDRVIHTICSCCSVLIRVEKGYKLYPLIYLYWYFVLWSIITVVINLVWRMVITLSNYRE